MQSGLLSYDVLTTVERLKALTFSVPQQLVFNGVPSVRRSKFIIPHCYKVNRKNNSALVKSRPRPRHSAVLAGQISGKGGKAQKLYSYLPDEFVDYGPHRQVKGFHVGTFTGFCPISQTFGSYICCDYERPRF